MDITSVAGNQSYGNPFIGPLGHINQIKLDVSTLTTDEVDSNGYLKPGVPLTLAGALLAATGLSTAAAAVAKSTNTGNGTVGSVVGKAGGKSEVISLTATSSSNFLVVGSRSGRLGNATVGTPYTSAAINFTITAGGTGFASGDQLEIVLTEATPDRIHGVTVEAIKLPGRTDNSSLSSDTTDPIIAVATSGLINRDIAEDILGRAYSALEIAAFLVNGGLVLTGT